ncbi:unc [Drosophila busckii]|uniref:Unc n=1 Tax=Drosophila busckii TaxID=30019 RepID=A0A0M3QYZ6_DROBS|nr:unc [Drosophila busckii]
MKARQRPTAASSAVRMASGTPRPPIRQPQATMPCERERRHELARKERETQAQQQKAKPAPKQLLSKQEKNKAKETKAPTSTTALATVKENAGDEETARLRLQLEHLAQLSEQDFEREFRQWMKQEGVECKVHTQLRSELINSFTSTPLGQLLSKVCAKVSATPLSPLELALHTLVSEFLYAQSCHFTLSVYCSETPQQQALPNFEERANFRFDADELQQLLSQLLGQPQQQLQQRVTQLYAEQQQSLLLALLQALLQSTAMQQSSSHAQTQTVPNVCLPAGSAPASNSQLYLAKQLTVNADASAVYLGLELSQSLHGVQQQLAQLLLPMQQLWKSCAPPVEVITPAAFEQLVQQELQARQALTEPLMPGQTAVQLPPLQSPTQSQLSTETAATAAASSLSSSPPPLPELHTEQLASLAMVQQSLQSLQGALQQRKQCAASTLQRLEAMLGELAGCVQALSNVLNLAMEQEYAVGKHKGYKHGYREGLQQAKQQHKEKAAAAAAAQPTQSAAAATQTEPTAAAAPAELQTVGTQTTPPALTHAASNTTALPALAHASSQTAAAPPAASKRSYEQWIHEMLHSSSGKIFLDRVELSLNKALELQKQRLDELYQIKMRHHAEMLRLNRRQSNWRSLCQHVERDSHTAEARELVRNIFRLLEHYEAHHQLLADKIKQTELAAQQATRIQPVWQSPPPAPAPAPAAVPLKPRMQSVATNTQLETPPPPPQSELKPKAKVTPSRPSFNEALLCAKTRMQQLEQESDLLEQSFLGYLERARSQQQQLQLRASFALERQQLQLPLDCLLPRAAEPSEPDAAPPPPPPPPLVLPPSPCSSSSSELEQESYRFTNAIAVARRKLFEQLQANAIAEPAPAPAPSVPTQQLLETQEAHTLLQRVEATLARVSQPASLQLRLAEAANTTPESSSAELPAASRKLQRSLAKMQQLFGESKPAQQAARAWSAPIRPYTRPQSVPMPRPHTAPSQLRLPTPTAAVQQPSPLLALLDDDTSAGSSSSLASIEALPRSYAQLLTQANDKVIDASSPTSQLTSSVEFWRRLNL